MQANGIEFWGKRVVVRSPNWLGDAVMVLPAVRRLREVMPGRGDLVVLAPEGLRGLWEKVEGVTRTIPVDANVWITGRTVREVEATGAVIFPNSPRTALEVWLGGVPFRAGFGAGWRDGILTRVVKREPMVVPRHQAEDYLRL
ncbi:MAG: hypothetical protein SNJ84_08295, partial [Verrucomicrobiia bacterium]